MSAEKGRKQRLKELALKTAGWAAVIAVGMLGLSLIL